MKTSLEIVNVVCSGAIPVEGIELDEVVSDMGFPAKEHGKSGKDIEFENGGMTLYESGKCIIRANNEEKLEATQEEFVEALSDIGFEFDIEDYNFVISNFVGYGKLNRTIDLNKLALAMGLEDTDYEGEQFSGLIYRGYPIAATFYSNGKVILLGANSREQIEEVFYDMVVEDIQEFSERIGL